MNSLKRWLLAGLLACGFVTGPSSVTRAAGLTAEQELGKALFADKSLSHGGNQACSSCHSAGAAFTDPDKSSPTSKGDNPALFGNRNAPTAMYQSYAPDFHFDQDAQDWVGGQFVDGRAANLEEQAKGPFLNPVEMGNASKADVIARVAGGSYADLFRSVYGGNALDDVEDAYNKVAQAIASYERSQTFAPFTSKYDAFLAGKSDLTASELAGLSVFEDPAKGNCAACHPSQPSADGTPPLFTDFTYDNLGIPKNPHNEFYKDLVNNPEGADLVDIGLGKITGNADDNGRFKVGTLRNIAMTGPYGHNGYFDTLEQIIDFYNTRDVKPPCPDPNTDIETAETLGCWPAPEVAETVNHDELGNLGLTPEDVASLKDFLNTLTDGWWDTTAVSEPETLALLVLAGLGLAAIAGPRRRRG